MPPPFPVIPSSENKFDSAYTEHPPSSPIFSRAVSVLLLNAVHKPHSMAHNRKNRKFIHFRHNDRHIYLNRPPIALREVFVHRPIASTCWHSSEMDTMSPLANASVRTIIKTQNKNIIFSHCVFSHVITRGQ